MKNVRTNLYWLGAVGFALVNLGCGNALPEPRAVERRAELKSFSGPKACEELEEYIEDTAVLQMRSQLLQAKEGYYGGWWGFPMAASMDRTAPAAEMSANAGSAAPSAYTTTNTQVAGVDEADFVKNDGTRIFVLSGNTLYASKSWPANEMALVGKLEIEGWPAEMFLDEQNHVVVFSSIWSSTPFDSRYGMADCLSMDCGYYYSNSVKVTVVNVADLAAPKVEREFYLPGSYNSSRRVGSSVRVVLSSGFNYPPAMEWYPSSYQQTGYDDKGRLDRAYDELIAKNEKLIREQSLDAWLPKGKYKKDDGQKDELPRECSDFYYPNGATELGLLTIATLDLSQPQTMKQTTVVANAGQVYASANNLYVANTHWWWWPKPGQQTATYLHKFDITQPDRAVYVGSGMVDGRIVDQFSMDENAQGYFRIASTIESRVTEFNNPWGRLETTNRVFVLAETNNTLQVVGSSEELAKGERIQSARFMEDKGYVVTFRQVDPLFTFDLSDPTNPRKVGELKVPGFSSYIHPLDSGHLLTIGTYIPEDNTDWRARALQLAIFDVSDLANPQQTHVQLVGTAYGWSEAQHEHKAFNYFPERKLLAIPFYDWNYNAYDSATYWSGFVSDLRVYEVDAATGFTPKGAISMKDLYTSYSDYGWYYWWSPQVRRSIMADQYVYAISDAGMRVADVANLSSTLAEVKFERETNGGGTGTETKAVP